MVLSTLLLYLQLSLLYILQKWNNHFEKLNLAAKFKVRSYGVRAIKMAEKQYNAMEINLL